MHAAAGVSTAAGVARRRRRSRTGRVTVCTCVACARRNTNAPPAGHGDACERRGRGAEVRIAGHRPAAVEREREAGRAQRCGDFADRHRAVVRGTVARREAGIAGRAFVDARAVAAVARRCEHDGRGVERERRATGFGERRAARRDRPRRLPASRRRERTFRRRARSSRRSPVTTSTSISVNPASKPRARMCGVVPHRARDYAGGATGLGGGSPASTASTFSAAISAMRVRVSVVADAMCGASTVFGAASNAGSTAGSRSNTSRPAPAIAPAVQRARQRRLVDHRTARGVDDERRRFHARELRRRPGSAASRR